jgi:hypothetical protein
VLLTVVAAASEAQRRGKKALLHVVADRPPGHASEVGELLDPETSFRLHAREYRQ